MLITPGCRSVDSTQRSQILAQNRDFRVCTPPAFDAPVIGGWSLSEYCHDVWNEKTIGPNGVTIPDSENILKICLLVLIEFTNVTDRHTDRHHILAAFIYSIARQKKNEPILMPIPISCPWGKGMKRSFLGNQTVKGQGHRKPKLDLEAWQRHHFQPSWVNRLSSCC